MDFESWLEGVADKEVSRRKLFQQSLRVVGGGAFALAAGPILAACGQSNTPTATGPVKASDLAEAASLAVSGKAPRPRSQPQGRHLTQPRPEVRRCGWGRTLPFRSHN